MNSNWIVGSPQKKEINQAQKKYEENEKGIELPLMASIKVMWFSSILFWCDHTAQYDNVIKPDETWRKRGMIENSEKWSSKTRLKVMIYSGVVWNLIKLSPIDASSNENSFNLSKSSKTR